MRHTRHVGTSRRPIVRIGALAAALLAASICFTVGSVTSYADVPSAGSTSSAVPSGYVVLTASSLNARGLTYVGTFSVSTRSGHVDVLRFTLTDAALAAMSVTQPCESRGTTVTAARSATLGRTTFDALRLAATAGGTPLSFTVLNPPTGFFPSELLLQDLTITATTVSAQTLRMPSFTTYAATC